MYNYRHLSPCKKIKNKNKEAGTTGEKDRNRNLTFLRKHPKGTWQELITFVAISARLSYVAFTPVAQSYMQRNIE